MTTQPMDKIVKSLVELKWEFQATARRDGPESIAFPRHVYRSAAEALGQAAELASQGLPAEAAASLTSVSRNFQFEAAVLGNKASTLQAKASRETAWLLSFAQNHLDTARRVLKIQNELENIGMIDSANAQIDAINAKRKSGPPLPKV